MDSKYLLQIGGTGLLLAALAAGFAGLKGDTSGSRMQKVTIVPQKKEDGSLESILKVDIGELCSINDTHDDSFSRLSSLLDLQGKPRFSCEEKLLLLGNKIDANYIERLSTLKNSMGKYFFTGKDIVAYHQAKGTFDYAEKFATVVLPNGEFMFRGDQTAQLYALGITVEEMLYFKDTSKPNALLIYPAKDNERGVFRNQDVVIFHNQIKEEYDRKVVVAAREQEVYDALDSTRDIELLILSGHGIDDSLSLGENDLRYKSAEKDETYTIDASDWELGWHLQNLRPSATIFLYSCLTGSGGEEGKNLANAIAEWADGRKVIAPTKVLRTDDVQVNNLYPFNVTIFHSDEKELLKKVEERKREDITYITTVKK